MIKTREEFLAEEKAQEQKDITEAGKWIRVGMIGVDAGLCWIGDPCYIIQCNEATDKYPEDLGKSWSGNDSFCDKLWEKEKESGQPAAQFNYDLGHAGLGVCVQTGYGDGGYDVFIKKNKEGRVMEAKVVFIQEDEEEESDE